MRLVYTPLNGSGLEPVRRLLSRMGIPDENITVVLSQEQPDGDFPTCPYPNPEIREAMAEGLRLCDTVRPDLLLGTDPDCDRMGAAVPDSAGGYRLITGNEMGVHKKGTMYKKPAEPCRVRLRRLLWGWWSDSGLESRNRQILFDRVSCPQ